MNMSYTLENILINCCFITLFITMIFYWLQGSQLLENFSLAPYTMRCSNILLGLILVTRWYNAHHFPLSNLFSLNCNYNSKIFPFKLVHIV